MSTKVLKYISVCVLALALGVLGTGVARAALTANATALSSDGVLTITGNDVSVWSVASAAADDNLTISVTGATDSSLFLSSTGTGADALTLTTTAGGLDISVTGTADGEDLDITTAGATTEMRLTSASTTSDSIAIQATTTTAGIDIDSGTGGIAINTATTGAINIDTGTTGAINLGVGAAAKTITIGNAASTLLDLNAISVDIDGGATGVTIDALDAGTINLGTSTDSASDTSAINIGTSATARTITIGGGDASIFVINGRVASEAIGGTEIGLDSSYTYGEGLELRYGVDDWTGIAGSFKGYYFRTEANVESASYGVRGMEVYSVLDIDTGTAGIQSLTGLYSELLVKAPATSYTIAGYPNSIEANFSYEAATAGTTTITNGVAALVAKIQTATGLASYTNLDGVRIIGRDADAVRVMGDGLAIENDAVGSHATWTNAIAISAGAATGINITGAMTTADIALQSGETIANATDNQFLFSAPGGANTVTINAADSDANAALVVRAGGTGALTLGNTANTSVTIAADGTTDADLVLPLTSVSGAEMVDNTVTTTQLAAALTFAALDFVDLALVVQDTTANQGLRLPQAASATPSSPTSGEGYLAWNVAGNQLIAYDGSAWITALGNATAANTWTDNQLYTFGADEDIVIDSATTDTTVTTGVLNIDVDTVTASAIGVSLDFQVGDAAASSTYYALKNDLTIDTDADQTPTVYGNYIGLTVNDATAVTYGLAVEQAAAAELVTAGILVDNLDTDDAMTNGILIRSAAGTIVDGVDVSDDELTNAINVGDNIILGAAAVINFTGFDVAATTGATIIAGNAAGTAALTLSLGDLVLIDTDTTTITSVNGTTTVVLIDNAGGVQADNTAALLIDAGGNNASGSNMLRLAPTGTPVEASVGIEFVGSTKLMQAMNIDGDSVDNSVVLINGGGALASGKGVLEVTNDGNLASGGTLVSLTLGGTPNAGAIAVDIDAQKDAQALKIDSDAATNSAVLITGAGNLADDKAMLEITNTGTTVAGSSLVRIASTTAAGGATVYGLEIATNAANLEGLWVSAGKAVFAENVTITAGGLTVSAGDVLVNDGAVAVAVETVASAGAMAIDSNVVSVTGTETIGTITGGVAGQTVILIFGASLTVTDDDSPTAANAINVAGTATNFSATATDTLTLVFDGTSWYEVARSVND
ncbi:MAG: hypothetical protein HYU04_01590 [Candidatus Wildermuthbacteria bacterium]|nr:hypothetical protein [Candidatus Wildermuthbacteria bacterium]